MAAASDDPCVILGLQEGTSQKQVESAFRRRALACHPDRNPKDPLAKKKFLRLTRAKEILLSRLANRPRQSKVGQEEAKPRRESQARARKASEKARKEKQVREANRRCAEAEKLRQREAAAAQQRRRREVEEAQAEVHRDAMRAEDEKREKAAALDRQRAAVLEAFWQRKAANAKRHEREPRASEHCDQPDSASLDSARSLIAQFAAATARTLRLAGPFVAGERSQIFAAAQASGYKVVEESTGLVVSKQQVVQEIPSDEDSPWEPPAESSSKRTNRKRFWAHSSERASKKGHERASSTKHQRALERLATRHHSGDRSGILRGDPVVLPGRSWWVHDEEADRYAKSVARCGF